jgi:hypothetical protein
LATNNPQTLKLVSVGVRLFAAIPLVIGLGLLTGACYSAHRQFAIVSKWPTVDAVVARSELTRDQHLFLHDTRPQTVYQARIDFRYTVAGQPYTIPTGAHYSSTVYAEMKRKVDAYPPGSRHVIRYNPANPNDMRYDAGYTLGFFMTPLLLLGVGLPSAACGAMLYAVGRKIGKSQTRCPSCRAAVGPDDLYCPACGAPMPRSQ